ncbi:MAG: VWA domain-containing protein, partial [Pirellulaceae bacterium]
MRRAIQWWFLTGSVVIFGFVGCGRDSASDPARYGEMATDSADYAVEDGSNGGGDLDGPSGEYDTEEYGIEEYGIEEYDTEEFNTEAYDLIVENEFVDALQNPKSTFSIDVDTASYSNVRRMLNAGRLPPAGAVRIEELINYFRYDYPAPDGEHPFHVAVDVAGCPWTPDHQLLRVAMKGKTITREEVAGVNLVFLLDVSGSMQSVDKLPLVQSGMQLLVQQLGPDDRVAMVVYAGASGLALPSTPIRQSKVILDAIANLQAGGSTNGGEGIELAYDVAQAQFVEGGINRVILCTDGDFNVGVTSQSRLIQLIQDRAQSGVFLSVLGFGKGNYNDSMMEKLADKGNGNYAYIDSLLEARKVLVEQIGGTLVTIAKDVKIQIDFNPTRVIAYRLIGYENRLLENEDFRDDSKDAGELGAGHTVTALYEIVPAGVESPARTSKPSKFVETVPLENVDNDQLLHVSLRYKLPESERGREFSTPLMHADGGSLPTASTDFQFAISVATFGMLLRDSKFAGSADWDWVIETAEKNLGTDHNGLRAEFVQLAKTARRISPRTAGD